MFDFINIPFAYVMRFFDSFTGNYALTLLLFAILIKVIFLPLGIKQQKNQIKQASLRPKEDIIRKKYAGRDDKATKQKCQQEIMELYQKENFNPMGGCLPLVVQLVVIMALYQIIRNPLTYICGIGAEGIDIIKEVTNFAKIDADQIGAINAILSLGTEAREALFAQIPELAKIPNFNMLGLDLTFTPSVAFQSFTSALNVVIYSIIPVACFILQFATMKLTRKFTYQPQANVDMQNNMSMKLMEYTMPLMSLFFCFTFPSAIGLYWIYQNVLSFGQTVLLAKTMPVPKYTEEDLRRIEKEMKAKGFDTKKSSIPRVRSLHHIDDDDYESLPTVENGESMGKTQPLLNGEKVPLKENNDKKKKKD